MKKPNQTKTVGYGYVGRWFGDGELGEDLPTCMASFPRSVGGYLASANQGNIGKRSYLCRITIEQVFDKKGRPIVRRIKA